MQAKPLILAIDDVPINLMVLEKVLCQDFDLQFASSGAMGLMLAQKTPPDLILLDILMPEMDGFETCKRLKAIPKLKDIPVVFVSANTDEDFEFKGLTLGAVDYITKPINVQITRQRICNLIEREALRRNLMIQRDLFKDRVSELKQVTQVLLKTQGTLAESESLKRAILNSLTQELVVLDESGVIQAINGPWCQFARDNPQASGELALHINVGDNYLDVCKRALSSDSSGDKLLAEDALRGIQGVLDGTLPHFRMEYPCHSPTQERWFTMVVSPLKQSPSRGVVITHSNITERRKIQAKLIESEAHLRTVILNEPECIKIVDAAGMLTQMNPAGLAMIQADSFEVVNGRQILDLVMPEHRLAFSNMHQRVLAGESVQLEFEIEGLKGQRRWVETHAVPMQHHGQPVQLAVTRDITERKQAEQTIYQLAFYDALTKLPNRRLLNDRLSQAITSSKRSGCHGALMFLDMDNFKPLNDLHGHDGGDLLLVEVARRLCACVREMDTVARFGGDEFVVMLSELDIDKAVSTEQAHAVAEKIRIALSEPYFLNLNPQTPDHLMVEHHCTASIGVALFNTETPHQDKVLKWADHAMYEAKNAGRNTICIYKTSVHHAA